MPKKKLVILVVEGHPEVRDVIANLMQSWGNVELITCYTFLTAAMAIAQTPHLDLLLCDGYTAEAMTGIELAEIAVKAHPQVAIVITTSDPQKSVPEFCDRYGFLRRPFSRNELLKQIDRAFVSVGRDEMKVQLCFDPDNTTPTLVNALAIPIAPVG